jgi:hypothetical protein
VPLAFTHALVGVLARAPSGDRFVPNAFSIAHSRCSVLSDPALLQEIRTHTESDAEADSILRSIERFGDDQSIRYYEMTPRPRRGAYRQAFTLSWSVRAVRNLD